MFTIKLKHLFTVAGATILFSLSTFAIAVTTPPPPPPPNPLEPILRDIRENTNKILQNVSGLPAFFQRLYPFLLNWVSPDDSDTTAGLQSEFAKLGKLLIDDMSTQSRLQQQLNTDLLVGGNPTTLPNANDLVYSSMLGSPFYSNDPRGKNAVPQYNYVKNASGITLPHVIPSLSWRGEQTDVQQYQRYYNSVMAVESYNAYVLGSQYADGNQFNDTQTKLINQATDPSKWFAKVASENIGWVLRQLLMYQSQTFVLLTQLVQTQKQMATAQVMTNTLLIATNAKDENTMVTNAQGSA